MQRDHQAARAVVVHDEVVHVQHLGVAHDDVRYVAHQLGVGGLPSSGLSVSFAALKPEKMMKIATAAPPQPSIFTSATAPAASR